MPKFNSVLLVDDDYVNNFVTEKILRKADIAKNIKTVRNGEDALTYLSEEKNPCPELILLDLNMPEMDGIHFLKYFKKMVLDKKVKVILLTGFIGQKQKDEIDDIGYFSILQKPLTPEKLYFVLQERESV